MPRLVATLVACLTLFGVVPGAAGAVRFGLAEVRGASGATVAKAGVGSFAYPSAGAGVSVRRALLVPRPLRAVLTDVSLLGGRIKASSVVVPAVGLRGARVEGLVVDGIPYPVHANTLVTLGPGSYLVALQEAVEPGLTSTQVGLVGLRLHIGARMDGLARGTEVWVGLAAAARGGGDGHANGPASEIPARLIPIYQKAAHEFGVPWTTLAAINKAETGFGTNLNVSSAGAIGWMQFLPAEWKQFGIDGDHDGKKNPYDPYDAIPAAASYLARADAARDLAGAVFSWNHSTSYVAYVLGVAASYAKSTSPGQTGPLDPARLGG